MSINNNTTLDAAEFLFVDLVALAGGNDCPADLNGNGTIGIEDLTILLSHFGMASGASPADGDLDSDDDVDLADLAALLAAFGTACP